MSEIVVSRNVEAPLSVLWRSWDRFGEIGNFHPRILSSAFVPDRFKSSENTGCCCGNEVGKTRLGERIIAYQPEDYMVIKILDTNSPLKNACVTLDFLALSRRRSRVTLRVALPGGLSQVSRLPAFAFKRRLRSRLTDLLQANASFVELRTADFQDTSVP